MNRKVAAISVLAAIVLVGCASAPQYAAKSSRIKRVSLENDMAYVNAVESAARRHGVGVVWVHPPRKEVPPSIP